ncbi:TPA: four helix bundle protein [Candidatus Berkelbacteria bacterium]|uniref:S23 ribosomal protein n=1 Tax=Berkelbacteria bacterium GW2011_GWE1_39_12 TaxID=1618337 RepID=A0A0G4B312_9BACT|nr:MAG: S23 ribosomal protein [Berkelbacteria bacterium GW2011_GWE1_39_12]HBO60797.1 four helix bundle protein [Candidatus Berkelbacteria bacterium]
MLSHSNPLGYRNLLTWQQANDIFELTEKFVVSFPSKHPKTGQYLTDLKDQMIRSARSVVRNIEEGYLRTSTKEYISFLGFSAGSLEELIGDFKYCQKGEIGDPKGCAKGIQMGVGEAKMLQKQIKSLEEKGYREKTVSGNDMARKELKNRAKIEKDFDEYLKDILDKSDNKNK